MQFDSYDTFTPTNARKQLYGLIERINRPSRGVLIQGKSDKKSAVLISTRYYNKLMGLNEAIIRTDQSELTKQLAILNGLDNFRIDDDNPLFAGGYRYTRDFFASLVNDENHFDVEVLAAIGTFAVYMLSINEVNINFVNLAGFAKQPYDEWLKQWRIARAKYGEKSSWAYLTEDCLKVIGDKVPGQQLGTKVPSL